MDTPSTRDAKIAHAVKLFQNSTMSAGLAAKFAGYGREDFMDLLSALQVPVINYSRLDLIEEIASIDRDL